jgi:hypothetical protein
MVLENVKEMWTETPRNAQGRKGRPVNKDRFISKMLVPPAEHQVVHVSLTSVSVLQVLEGRLCDFSVAQLKVL